MNQKDKSAIESWKKDKDNLFRINALLVRARQSESEITIERIKNVISLIGKNSYSFHSLPRFALVEQNIGRYLLEKCPSNKDDILKGISHLESSIRKLEMQGKDRTYSIALSYYYLSKAQKEASKLYEALYEEDSKKPGLRKLILDMDSQSAQEYLSLSKNSAKKAIIIMRDLILVSPEDKLKNKLFEIEKWFKKI